MGRQDVEIFGLDPDQPRRPRARRGRRPHEARRHGPRRRRPRRRELPRLREDALASRVVPVRDVRPPLVVRAQLSTRSARRPTATRTSSSATASACSAKTKCSPLRASAIHTGQSDPLNQQFAESFTAHFAELADKYPVYGELRTIFDLALAARHHRSRRARRPRRLGSPRASSTTKSSASPTARPRAKSTPSPTS